MTTLSERQICTFFLGDLYFGVEVERIQEVINYQFMSRVPLASPAIRGLINLRGQIVTAIDLRQRFMLPDRGPDLLPMNVVLRTEDGPVSLLVDEIGDVLEVDDALFDRVPETLTGIARDLVRGVYKLSERLLLILDTDRALSMTQSSLGS